jgi:hypothetical protein
MCKANGGGRAPAVGLFFGLIAAIGAGCAREETPSRAGQDAAVQPAARPAPALPDFAQSSGWLGADGATTVDLGDGRVLWLFGDTFVGTLKPDGGCAPGTKMVNNTIAVQTLPRGSEPGSMTFHWGPEREGEPTSWALSPAGVGEKAKNHWMWPSGGGIRVGAGEDSRLVLIFAMMRRRDASDSVWNFEAHGAAAVTVLNPGAPAAQWRTEVTALHDDEADLDARRPVRLIAWGPVVMADPDSAGRALIFGVDGSKVLDKRVVLARAPRETIQRFETWEFRTPAGWSAREADAAPIAAAATDVFSVSRVEQDGHARFLMIQTEANLGKRIMARFADKPEGPWSEGRPVFTCPEPGQDSRSFVYAATGHPEVSGSDALLVTYCVNSTDFWHVVGHVALYRPRAIELAWSSLMWDEPGRAGRPKESEGVGAPGR